MSGTVQDKDGNAVGYFHQECQHHWVSENIAEEATCIKCKESRVNPLAKKGYTHDLGVVQLPPFESKPRKDYHTPAVFRYPSTRDDLIKFMDEYFEKCKQIALERNARYASPLDAFKNFRLGGEYGIVVRAGDKVSRLINLTTPNTTLTDGGESVEDSCYDLSNYGMLLHGYRMNERGER